MAFDFPSSPAVDQIYQNYRWDGEKWVILPSSGSGFLPLTGGALSGNLTLNADPTDPLHAVTKGYVDSREAWRNRVVNGAMQISQEHGDIAGTTTGYYPADQWRFLFALVSGTAVVARAPLATANGSRHRIRSVVTAADASLADGEYLLIVQAIEGVNVCDFLWGTSIARSVTLRFGFAGSAGTYSAAIVNGDYTRSYVANFTITAEQANSFTEHTITIPGDEAGTWAIDSSIGLHVIFCFAAGASYRTALTGWQTGYFFATTSNTNGMATLSNLFDIYDVGLYLDVDDTGTPPRWEIPNPVTELMVCQRYYQFAHIGIDFLPTDTGQVAAMSVPFTTYMRTAPSVVYGVVISANVSGGNPTGVSAYAYGLSVNIAGTAIVRTYWYGNLALDARL